MKLIFKLIQFTSVSQNFDDPNLCNSCVYANQNIGKKGYIPTRELCNTENHPFPNCFRSFEGRDFKIKL